MVLNMSIRVVELFAGVGGFRVGLNNVFKSDDLKYETNQFDFVWANQWEPGKKIQHAFNCYVKHFGESDKHINQDIAEVKDSIPDHDLLVGGFPCQDYSVAATGAKGIQGKKGVLWWEIRDIVENKRPKYILLENVDRLIKSPTSQRGRDFGVMLKSLDELGYTTEWRVINAADYGNAQRRRRIFIFAYRNNTNFYNKVKELDLSNIILEDGLLAKVFHCERKIGKSDYQYDLKKFPSRLEVSDSFNASFLNSGICRNGSVHTIEVEPIRIPFIPLNQIIHTKEEEVDSKYFIGETLDKWHYLKNAKKVERKKPNGELYYYSEGPVAFPENLDLPARTMLTSESTINRSTHVINDAKTQRLRLLTEVECERLNGFEDNWTNTNMPSRFRYFCMGNALVVNLVTMIGREIVKLDS